MWNLIGPEWSARWVKSQMALYDAGGWLGKGPAGMRYVPVMVAEHEIPQMVSAWQMGIRPCDPEKMMAAFKKMQTTPAQKVGRGYAGNRNLQPYLEFHYVPSNKGTPGEKYAKFPVVQGNQQSMHFAFLFNWAGEPWER